jgi:hypothetical protein
MPAVLIALPQESGPALLLGRTTDKSSGALLEIVGFEKFVDESAEMCPVVSGEPRSAFRVPVGAQFDELGVVVDGVVTAEQGGELAVENPVDLGVQLINHPAEDGVAGCVASHTVEGVVGGEGSGDVVLINGLREVLVGSAHAVDVIGGHMGNSGPDGEFVQGPENDQGCGDVVAVERRDACVHARFGLDEPGVGEAGEGLADRRAAEPETLGDLAVPDLFPRSEFAADDRVLETLVRI